MQQPWNKGCVDGPQAAPALHLKRGKNFKIVHEHSREDTSSTVDLNHRLQESTQREPCYVSLRHQDSNSRLDSRQQEGRSSRRKLVLKHI